METKETIGIDVSKKKLDVHIHGKNMHRVFDNCPKGIKKMIEWVLKNTDCTEKEIMFAFEHTGLYSHQLSATLSEGGLMYTAIPGLEIKRPLGLARGKPACRQAGTTGSTRQGSPCTPTGSGRSLSRAGCRPRTCSHSSACSG